MPHYGRNACMPILLAKNSMPARQIDKFAPLHTLKSVVVNPKTDCQFEKMVFLRSLRPAGGDPGLDHFQKYFFDSLCFLEWTWPF